MASPKAKQLDAQEAAVIEGAIALAGQADVDLRNHFAGIAFREIVAWQVATGKAGQEDVAASWAFRYGDRALARSKEAPKGAPVMVRGHQEPVFEEPPNMGLPTEPVPPIAADAPGLPV